MRHRGSGAPRQDGRRRHGCRAVGRPHRRGDDPRRPGPAPVVHPAAVYGYAAVAGYGLLKGGDAMDFGLGTGPFTIDGGRRRARLCVAEDRHGDHRRSARPRLIGPLLLLSEGGATRLPDSVVRFHRMPSSFAKGCRLLNRTRRFTNCSWLSNGKSDCLCFNRSMAAVSMALDCSGEACRWTMSSA